MDASEGAEVLDILDDGTDDDRLLGIYETQRLDFKGSPYRLSEPREQWELGKDVAALARDDGGVIVIGVHTERDERRDEERASRVAPFPHSMLDAKQAADVINRDVYPPIEGLEVRVYDRGDKRLAAIVLPEQDPDRQPFMLTHLFDEDGERWHAFVLPRRSGSHTQFEPVGLVHRDLADGRRWRRAGPSAVKVPPMEERAAEEPSRMPPAPGHAEDWLKTEATEMDRLLEWMVHGVIYAAAVPLGRRERPADFYAVDGFRRAFSHERQLRPSGFGLTYGHNVSIEDGSILSVDAERTALRVQGTGHSIAAAAGTENFLGWAMDQGRRVAEPGTPLKINPVTLAEWVYEFCRFVTDDVVPRWGNSGWTLAILVRRAQQAARPLRLPSDYRRETMWMFEGQDAESDERVDSASFSGDPAADAITLLSIVYGVFGLDPGKIPFNKDGRFDEHGLLALQ